jgi:hypothetical protein
VAGILVEEALSLALFVRTCHNLCVSRCRSGFGSEQLVEVSRSPSTGEFEVVIMIESVTEEMHRSIGVSDSETDYERALVAMAEPSTRAKWRALRSAPISTPKKCLTGATSSDRRV